MEHILVEAKQKRSANGSEACQIAFVSFFFHIFMLTTFGCVCVTQYYPSRPFFKRALYIRITKALFPRILVNIFRFR